MKTLKTKLKNIAAIFALAISVSILALSLAACGNKNSGSLKFIMPDGTPALSVARLFADNKTIAGKNIDYKITAQDALVGEMKLASADIIVMPTNTGVQQIVKNGGPYKMVSVNVEGNLYVVGANSGSNEITWEMLKGKKVLCIGQTSTPDIIFRYIIENTDGIKIGTGTEDINLNYVSDASVALPQLIDGRADYAVIAEPAATVWANKNNNAGKPLSARMSLQTEYLKVSGNSNFPQASMFVKTSLLSDINFVTELKAAVTASVNWVLNDENKTAVQAFMKDIVKSTSTFLPASLQRTNICAKFTSDIALQASVLSYLEIMNITADSDVFF